MRIQLAFCTLLSLMDNTASAQVSGPATNMAPNGEAGQDLAPISESTDHRARIYFDSIRIYSVLFGKEIVRWENYRITGHNPLIDVNAEIGRLSYSDLISLGPTLGVRGTLEQITGFYGTKDGKSLRYNHASLALGARLSVHINHHWLRLDFSNDRISQYRLELERPSAVITSDSVKQKEARKVTLSNYNTWQVSYAYSYLYFGANRKTFRARLDSPSQIFSEQEPKVTTQSYFLGLTNLQ